MREWRPGPELAREMRRSDRCKRRCWEQRHKTVLSADWGREGVTPGREGGSVVGDQRRSPVNPWQFPGGWAEAYWYSLRLTVFSPLKMLFVFTPDFWVFYIKKKKKAWTMNVVFSKSHQMPFSYYPVVLHLPECDSEGMFSTELLQSGTELWAITSFVWWAL